MKLATLTAFAAVAGSLVATAAADTIFVPQDYPTIQAAITAAADGDEIIVSPGTYNENINFLSKDITVRSTEPTDPLVVAATIIDGSQAGTVVTMTTGIIQGFTIRNGQAELAGGVHALNVAEIRDNVITENTATSSGGGIYADGDVVIEDNVIAENTAANNSGGAIFAQTRTVIMRNLIVGNSADVWGGGVNARHNCTVRNNTIAGNRATRGGGIYARDNVAIRANLIAGNSASDEGGGIKADDHAGAITSNTIIGNIASGYGSGAYVDGGVVSSNIVAFSPSSVPANAGAGSNTYVDYNCIYGNNGLEFLIGPNDLQADPQFMLGAAGVWTANPLFDPSTTTTTLVDSTATFSDGELVGQMVNPNTAQDLRFAIVANTQTTISVMGNASGTTEAADSYQIYDFHLFSGVPPSPCVSAGDPTQDVNFYAGSDIDGESRVQDCDIDIGADEAAGPPAVVLSIVSTMTTSAVEVSTEDCHGESDGVGSFNRFYEEPLPVTLTAQELFKGLPFRWVIDGVEHPFGEFELAVEMADHVTAVAEYFPVVNITQETYFTAIQDAVSHFGTDDGNEIVVYPSVYVENIDFLDKDVTVRSIDPTDPEIVGVTIIDGNLEDSVVRLSAGKITGFTLRNGRPYYGDNGGGVYASGTAIISYNIITENQASNKGAGIHAQNNVVIRNNLIINNSGYAYGCGISARDDVIVAENTIVGNTTSNDGGGIEARYNCLVTDNVITGNQARSGGGVYAQDDSVVFRNVITDNVATNRAGGVYALNRSTIKNNFILNNESQNNENGGGGIYAYHVPMITDNAIVGNTSLGPGGGMHLAFGADAIGNTIVNNTCATIGSGIFVDSLLEQIVLLNNVVAHNSGFYGIYADDPVELDYNCVFGNDFGNYGGLAAPGPHDLNVDPLLADDFIHLSSESPCVNAGDPSFVGGEEQTDIDGDPRVIGGRVDIGADEVVSEGQPGDLDGDGDVDAADLALLLGSWGPCPAEGDCPADLDGNGAVGPFDLAILLGRWG